MSETITIHLTISAAEGAPRVPLVVSSNITAADLRIESSKATKIPLDSLKLIFRGRLIAHDLTKAAVTEFKLEEGSVLHCMGRPEADSPAQNITSTASVPIPTVSVSPAEATSVPTAAAPAPIDSLKAALHILRASNPPESYQTAVSTLGKILGNIIDNPMEEKYRKVKKQNPAFQKRLGGLSGGDATMKATGFVTEIQDGEEVYQLNASADAWPTLLINRATVMAASIVSNSPNPPIGSLSGVPNAATPGVPNLMPPGVGGIPGGDQLTQLLSDPNAIQAMMQNPMVQAMLQSDPRFTGNPMLQNMIEELANNPQAAAQMSNMMRDPNVLSQIQQMQAMQQSGLPPMPLGPPPGTGSETTMDSASMMRMAQMIQHFNATRTPPTSQPPNGQAGAGVENDVETTEEEMIAEAIRRSLQDS